MKQQDPDGAYSFLLSLPRYAVRGSAAYRPGLERIGALLRHVGDPHLRYPTIHVAGTNGKGSVASIIAAILSASGLRVGLHTSPHFKGLEERMRIGSVPAPRDWVASTAARLQDRIEHEGASFFEATVLLSLLYFAEQHVDVAVVEVGLGGRFDATNVISPDLAVITDISLEHTEILGETVAEIAREKAGIIKASVQAVTIARGEALASIAAHSATVGANLENVRDSCTLVEPVVRLTETQFGLHTPERSYEDLSLDLAGRHQLWNAVLAIRGAELYASGQGAPLSVETVHLGAGAVREWAGLAGRLEVLALQPTIITDNAHNPQGLAAVLEHVRTSTQGELTVALGLMRDKDAAGIADLLARVGATVSVIELPGDRAMDARELHALLKHHGVHVDISSSVQHVVDHFRQGAGAHDVLLLTGSHLVVSEALDIRMTP